MTLPNDIARCHGVGSDEKAGAKGVKTASAERLHQVRGHCMDDAARCDCVLVRVSTATNGGSMSNEQLLELLKRHAGLSASAPTIANICYTPTKV